MGHEHRTVLSQTQALPSGWAAATPDGDTRWLAFDSKGNWTSVISVRGGEKIGTSLYHGLDQSE